MRAVTPFPLPGGASDSQKLEWCVLMILELCRASVEEPIKVFDSYSSDTTATVTRQVNVTSPSTSNLAAVLATLIADLRKRGVNRTSG